MKFGLDIHGVINKLPQFFSRLSSELISLGHEVHIITGSRITPELEEELRTLGMSWTFLFSITDHHLKLGNIVKFDEKGRPWIDETLWNKTKGEYCREALINFHLDDSEVYGDFFDTPYCLFNYDRKRFQWFYSDKAAGEFLFLSPEVTIETIVGLAQNFQRSVKEIKYKNMDYTGELND